SFSFDTLPQNVPHMKAGKLRPLAVTSRERSAIAPDVPTIVEAGMNSLIAENGVLNDAALAATFPPGHYEAVFHIADFYRSENVPLPATPFLDVVTYRFGIADSRQHYHLPFKMTPWGYSCFRGGA
ncbi:MAG: tripartite tricarboxylate transporter substrate-binding protein, partial [Burkholderiales bacterium]